MALQIVTEYLTDTLVTKLCSELGMTLEDITASTTQTLKRKSDWEYALEVSFLYPTLILS